MILQIAWLCGAFITAIIIMTIAAHKNPEPRNFDDYEDVIILSSILTTVSAIFWPLILSATIVAGIALYISEQWPKQT